MGRNYSDLLGKSLDAARLELLHLLAYQAAMLRMPLYLVGGVVRDILLGRTVNDFDLVVEGSSAEFAEYIVRKFGGKVLIHSKFMTATWVVNEATFKRLNFPALQLPDAPLSFDLVSARTETYAQPGALPTVKRSTIDDDLRRRDFSINAMSIRLDGEHFGELFDPLSGQKDLENKLVRVLHDKSFVDDPTRIFRAVRYAVRYGFTITPETLSLVNDEAQGVLSQLSGERLRHEFDLILEEKNALVMLEELSRFQILEILHPALQPIHYRSPLDYSLTDKFSGIVLPDIFSFHQTLGWVMWLIQLSPADIEAISIRFMFPSILTKAAIAASRLRSEKPSFLVGKPSTKTFYLDQFPVLAVYAAWVYFMWEETYQQNLSKYLLEWRHIKPYTTGYTLQQRGLEPGPKFKEILTRLRAAWLDGEVKTEDEEKKLLEELVK